MKKLLFKLGRFLVNRYYKAVAGDFPIGYTGCKCKISRAACLIHSPIEFEYPKECADDLDRAFYADWIAYVRNLPAVEYPKDQSEFRVQFNGVCVGYINRCWDSELAKLSAEKEVKIERMFRGVNFVSK